MRPYRVRMNRTGLIWAMQVVFYATGTAAFVLLYIRLAQSSATRRQR